MSQDIDNSDYQELLQAVNIEIKNFRDNITDARRAKRSSSGDDRRMYRSVIRYNKRGLQQAKVKRRFIEARTRSTWWLWLIAVLLCIVIMILVPGAPMILVFAPLWILLFFGFIYILMSVKK